MSYDLQVWSVAPVPLPDALPQRASWQRHQDAWTLEGRGWQLLIGASQRVFPEDIPGEVARQLPGIAYLIELNLSPITAEAARRQQLAKVASMLAKAGHGVILDPQTETITTPAGIKRFASPGPSEDASLLTFSWWMARGELVERSEVSTLLDALAATLPEALPRRYGQYEPSGLCMPRRERRTALNSCAHTCRLRRYGTPILPWLRRCLRFRQKLAARPGVSGRRT